LGTRFGGMVGSWVPRRASFGIGLLGVANGGCGALPFLIDLELMAVSLGCVRDWSGPGLRPVWERSCLPRIVRGGVRNESSTPALAHAFRRRISGMQLAVDVGDSLVRALLMLHWRTHAKSMNVYEQQTNGFPSDPEPTTASEDSIRLADALREALRRKLLNRPKPQANRYSVVGAD
jgi:hypothetical protein